MAQQSVEDSKNSTSLLFWDTGPGILGSTLRGSLKCLSKQEKTPEEMSHRQGKTDHVTRLLMLKRPTHTDAGQRVKSQSPLQEQKLKRLSAHKALCRA